MIKDFTGDICQVTDASQQGIVNITFTLYKPGTRKLPLVKAVKFATGLGLKISKDIVDESANYPIMFRQNLTLSQLNEFRDNLTNTDAEYYIDDLERIRNKKLIGLGICGKSDLIEELSNMDIQKILIGGFSTTKLKEILESIYSNITEEKLKEIYDNYKL